VALIFALASVAIFTVTGVAIDYARFADAKAKLQLAADSAALAVARDAAATTASQRKERAQQVVAAQFQIASPSTVETEPVSGGVTTYVVAATADVPLYFGGLVGMKSMRVGAQATAVASGSTDNYEIALALDNTGSMATVINDLRIAAGNFVNSVMTGPNVKVSVVPYVAAVNPGITDLSMIDTQKKSSFHADFLRTGFIAPDKSCVLNWGIGAPVGPIGNSSSGDTGGSAIDLIELLNPFRRFALELFGVSRAHAQAITPNTYPPQSTTSMTSTSSGKSFQVPAGFRLRPFDIGNSVDDGGCDWLINPWPVSHYDLFSRIKTQSGGFAAWKGCVEARPSAAELSYIQTNWGWSVPKIEDYDVKDIPPDSRIYCAGALFERDRRLP
jgi:Flp pilus assembly protein TadG